MELGGDALPLEQSGTLRAYGKSRVSSRPFPLSGDRSSSLVLRPRLQRVPERQQDPGDQSQHRKLDERAHDERERYQGALGKRHHSDGQSHR